MPQAVFHVLSALILADLIRDYIFKKRHFPLYLVLIAGIAGLLPDIDIFIYWIFDLFSSPDFILFHRTFTHSLLFVLLFLIPAFVLYNNKKWGKILLMVSFGVALHLLLDAVFVGTIMPFYPFSSYELGLSLLAGHFSGTLIQGIDAILLILWLIYIEWRHKISDFI